MSQVHWTPVAQSDLDDILYYVARVDRKPATGEQIFFEIRDAVAEHAEKRRPGHRHPEAPQGWLYLKHKRWLVFYRSDARGIEVMRVIDAVRDLPRSFREE
jgi:plasmid stabilization system protein ParE